MEQTATFIDTHCHMNMMVDKKFDAPLVPEHFPLIAAIVARAQQAGVGRILNVGTSLKETRNCIAIAQRHDTVWASAGIHPCDAGSDWRSEFEELSQLVKQKETNRIVAVGETGLDFFHKPYFKQRQIDCFKAHIELSLEHELPLVIHMRNSADETLTVLDEYHKEVRGTFHCFLQERYIADKGIEWGFVLGIDGPITYPKNQWFRDMVKDLPVEHLVFETDAPFLPPQHMRGKQNGPEHLPSFAQVVADLKDMSLEELARVTSANVKRVFGI